MKNQLEMLDFQSVWWWALTDSNRRPAACKADAYDRNSLIINYL